MADTRVFEIYEDVKMQEVRFTNRFGIELAGHLYLPANSEGKKNQAIAVAGPFGGIHGYQHRGLPCGGRLPWFPALC